jgi:hypothetical protein
LETGALPVEPLPYAATSDMATADGGRVGRKDTSHPKPLYRGPFGAGL